MSVIRDFAPFYRTGPIQARGPDASLRVGDRVKVLRREMGYSYVMLEDERSGFVATEYLAPAPPRPKPTPAPEVGDGPRRGPGGERYRGEQVNDTPLPETPPPALDLNVGPEEVVPLPPAPNLDPEEPPQFRY
jgi:hypothetical protein